MDITCAVDYDDVYLVPVNSNINSRNNVDISFSMKGLRLDMPIVSAPMKGISGEELVYALGKKGALGILHRFFDNSDDRINTIMRLKKSGIKFGAAIGLNDSLYKQILDNGVDVICVDVANGYTQNVLNFVEEVSNYIADHSYRTLVMAGNVVTNAGATNLYECGCDMVRVGIGSGQLCTTRAVTGVGIPQITAIAISCGSNWITVADGGIRTSGDIMKALAFGADLAMIGSLFGHTKEASNNGIIYGMASRKLQEEYYHNTKSIEGIEKVIDKSITLDDLLDELCWGMKSACTYLGQSYIKDIKYNAQFVLRS